MGAHLFSSWTTLFSLWAITWSKAGSTINVQSNWSFLPCSPVRKLLELTAVLITSAAAVQSHQLESFLGSFPPRSLSSRTHQTESGKMGRFHGRGPLSWLTPCLITMDRNLVRCFDPRCLFEPLIEDRMGKIEETVGWIWRFHMIVVVAAARSWCWTLSIKVRQGHCLFNLTIRLYIHHYYIYGSFMVIFTEWLREPPDNSRPRRDKQTYCRQ